MALDFVAIDFETANFARASACAVGLMRVRDGELAERDGWLIDPPGGVYFTNTFIHGITAEDVAGAPDWPDTLDRLEDFASGLPLVAYSGFDRGVYNAANDLLGIADRGFGWLNAHSLARRRFPDQLEDYRLPTVSDFLGVEAFAHHNATADAGACAGIVVKIAEIDGLTELDALWPAREYEKRPRVYVPKGPLPEPNLDADPSHPLYGQSICFTGKLDSFTQGEAERIAADFGCTIEDNVTKRTTLVVIGQFDPAHLRAGATLSNKAKKAQELAMKGNRIEVTDEAGFLAYINLSPADY